MSAPAHGPEQLLRHIGPIRSRMGTFYPGSHVIFRGQDLHADLKDMDWLELYVYGITGRRFSRPQLQVMHAIWTYTSYPDVRLWNNRVAALAASARSTGTLGVAAALAVSEASIYGGGILARAIDFFYRAAERVDAGDDLSECIREELERHRNIGGYGRPIINGDERIRPMMDLAKQTGMADGRCLKLAFAVEEVLLNGRWRMKMNYAAIVAALGADLGLSRQEFYLFMFPVFLAGMQPCYIEATEQQEGTLYPSRCTDILYDGPKRRPWTSEGKA